MVVDPTFSHDVFSLDDAIRFLFIYWKILFLEKYLELPLIFILFFFKGKQNKKKTLSVTHYLEKTVYGKPKSGTGVRLLIGNVW